MEKKIYKDESEKNIAKSVQFANIEKVSAEPVHRDIGMYVDISRRLKVELGKAKLTVRDILELAEGQIIELNKQAGESVDIYIDECRIARGEVVVVDEKFAVRVTEILELTDLEKRSL